MKKVFSRKYPALLLIRGMIAAGLFSPCWLSGKDWLPIPGKDLLPHKDAQAYYDSGTRDFQSGARQAAIDQFTKAIELDPSFIQAYDARATTRFVMKDYADAITDCDKVLGLTHDDEHVYLIKGLCRYYLHDLQGALKPLNTAVLMNTNDAMALVMRGTVLGELRKWDDAVADFTRAIQLNPDGANAYFGRAHCELFLKEYEKSLADISDSIEMDGTFAPAYSLRAEVKSYLKDRAGAFADANAGVKLGSSDIRCYLARVAVEASWDDFSHASNDLEIATQINPTNSDIYLCRALVEQKCGNIQAALADYTRGLAGNMDARSPFAYENLGYAQAEMGQWQLALESFRKAMACNSPPEGARFQVFLIECRLGQTEQAKKELAAYIQSIPAAKVHDWTASIAHFLAGTLNETNFLAEATATAKRATDIQGQTGDAWYFAGMQHLLAGDKMGARERLTKSLKVGDDNSDNYMMARAIFGSENPAAVNIQPSTRSPSDLGK